MDHAFQTPVLEASPGTARQKEVFIFVHLPKTGGQSLRSFFMRHLVANGEFVQLVSPKNPAAERAILPSDFEQRPLEERRKVRVLLGHVVNNETHKWVPDKTPRHILFVREPAETLVSYYNFQMKVARLKQKPTMDFEQWYDRSKRDNMMTRWILTHFMMEPHPRGMSARELKEVQKVLDTFWFVGCTECLDRDAPLLFQRIGVTGQLERANVGGVHYEKSLSLDAPLRERLRKENPLDVELYEYWRDRLDRSVARVRAEVQELGCSGAA